MKKHSKMNTEEKAKAYDKALSKAREYHFQGQASDKLAELESIFPELRESEDERIRKNLIQFLRGEIHEIDVEEAVAYLEKQKEHSMSVEEVLARAGLKSYKDGDLWCIFAGDNIQEGICGFGDTIEDALYEFLKEVLDLQKEQKPRKFKVGDKVHMHSNDTNVITITGFRDDAYLTDSAYGPILFSEEDNWEIVEQKPAEWSEEDETYLQDALWCIEQAEKVAKDEGDMGACWSARRWLKSLRPKPKPTEDELNKKYWEGYKDAMEQYNRNVSFHQDYPTSPSIPRSCFEGGPCTNPHYDCINCPNRGGGGTYITTPNTVTSDDSNNLEAHWKPSEQEKGALRTAIRILTGEWSFPRTAVQLQNILNAFEGKASRKEWKPSEEQMDALNAIICSGELSYVGQGADLISLRNDLKKLM